MHAKSENVEVMSYDNVNDIVDELFELLLSRYQGNLEMIETQTFLMKNKKILKKYMHAQSRILYSELVPTEP